MALLQKTGGDSDGAPLPAGKKNKIRPPRLSRGAAQAADACGGFLREYFPSVAEKTEAYTLSVNGGDVFLPAPLAVPETLRVMRNGVWAGSTVKGRFVPAHSLFMAYGAQCENAERLTRDDPRTARWLRGEAIPAETAAPGWTAVLADGFPLGFGKQSGGTVKNHYPKGLRNL